MAIRSSFPDEHLSDTVLFRFLERHMFPGNGIVLFVLYTSRMTLPAFGQSISVAGACRTFDMNDRSFAVSCHVSVFNVCPYSIILVTTPAPTVCPPSRIANRNSLSMAIGVINSTSNSTLSPGITISIPSGKVTTPVTSVVRK